MSDSDMSELEFRDIIKDVSSFFGAPRDRQMQIMYEIFRAYPYDQMKRACRFLIEHHDNRYFPTPRDIHDALREVAELHTPPPAMYDSPEDEAAHKCCECAGHGMMIADRTQGEYKYSVAVYCSCAKGRRMRRGHQDYVRRFHSGKGGQDD